MSSITVNSQTLKTLFAYTSYATAGDDSRPVLAGVNLRMLGCGEGNRFYAEATDGFRLATAWAPTDCEEFNPVIVPPEFIKGIVKQIGKYDEDVTLTPVGREVETQIYEPGENGKQGRYVKTGEMEIVYDRISASGAHVALTSRVIDGNFPEVSKLVPEEHKTEFGVRGDGLLAALKRCEVFAHQNNDVVKLTIWPNQDDGLSPLTVSANAAEFGSAAEHITQGIFSGDVGAIAFNIGYVIDILAHGKPEGVTFRMQGPNNAGVFIPHTGQLVNATAIVMPMHLAQ